MPFGVAAAAVGAAGTIGASLINKPSSSTQTNVQTPENTAGITYGQDQATNIYHNQNGQTYGGNFVAGLNNDQNTAINNANGWTTGAGGTLPTTVGNTANGLLGAGGNYVANANGMATGGIAGPNSNLMGTLSGYGTGNVSASGPNSGLSSALNTSAINGANANSGVISPMIPRNSRPRFRAEVAQGSDLNLPTLPT